MKYIKLLHDIPVAGRHGMKQNRILKVLETASGGRGKNGVWVRSDTKERVLILHHEYEEIVKKNIPSINHKPHEKP